MNTKNSNQANANYSDPEKMRVRYFNIGPYRFMFGPSTIASDDKFNPLIHTFCLWMWNGYYWHIEIADCPTGDLESAKYAMQFKLVEDRRKF